MAKPQIKWNLKGFRVLRTDPKVRADLEARAERIADAAGEGYVTDSGITRGRGRARASVRTGTPESMEDNAKNNTLIRSLDRGR